eukprot:gene18650-6080_t
MFLQSVPSSGTGLCAEECAKPSARPFFTLVEVCDKGNPIFKANNASGGNIGFMVHDGGLGLYYDNIIEKLNVGVEVSDEGDPKFLKGDTSFEFDDVQA